MNMLDFERLKMENSVVFGINVRRTDECTCKSCKNLHLNILRKLLNGANFPLHRSHHPH